MCVLYKKSGNQPGAVPPNNAMPQGSPYNTNMVPQGSPGVQVQTAYMGPNMQGSPIVVPVQIAYTGGNMQPQMAVQPAAPVSYSLSPTFSSI
jgi:hypothetical protein